MLARVIAIICVALICAGFFFHRRTGVDITAGLVIHLPLDGDLLDTSGNGNNGAFSGGSPSYVSVVTCRHSRPR